MSLKTFTYYHRDTGSFHSKVFKCSDHEGHEQDAADNAPADHVHIEGQHDAHRHRFDFQTERVVEIN